MHTRHAVREGEKFNADRSLEVVSCPTCHMVYAIPESLARSARAYPGGSRGGWTIVCPVGHDWHYIGKSVEEKLKDARELLSSEKAAHDQTAAHLRGERIAKSRFKNERDRLKQRVANGVCPCCNRTFKQLAAHMQSKHPEFVSEAVEARGEKVS